MKNLDFMCEILIFLQKILNEFIVLFGILTISRGVELSCIMITVIFYTQISEEEYQKRVLDAKKCTL